jgi:hypothetical protein
MRVINYKSKSEPTIAPLNLKNHPLANPPTLRPRPEARKLNTPKGYRPGASPEGPQGCHPSSVETLGKRSKEIPSSFSDAVGRGDEERATLNQLSTLPRRSAFLHPRRFPLQSSATQRTLHPNIHYGLSIMLIMALVSPVSYPKSRNTSESISCFFAVELLVMTQNGLSWMGRGFTLSPL